VPLDQLSSEEIEDTMTMLSELGITVTAGRATSHPCTANDQLQLFTIEPSTRHKHSRIKGKMRTLRF
jgi:sigma-70-like protein